MGLKCFGMSLLGLLLINSGFIPLMIFGVLFLFAFPAWFVEKVVLKNYHSPAFKRVMSASKKM